MAQARVDEDLMATYPLQSRMACLNHLVNSPTLAPVNEGDQYDLTNDQDISLPYTLYIHECLNVTNLNMMKHLQLGYIHQQDLLDAALLACSLFSQATTLFVTTKLYFNMLFGDS